MKQTKFILIFTLAICLSCCTNKKSEKNTDFTAFVNPFIGTDGPGNVYPGAQAPFGMVQLSPDNGIGGWDRISGYFYPDSTIASFSMTHLSGTGAGDMYDIAFMPVVRPYKDAGKNNPKSELGIYSKFTHDEESATAGYYSVNLSDYNIFVELSATERCGIQQYTFPKTDSASIFIDLNRAINWDFTEDTKLNIVDSTTVVGYRFSRGWAKHQKLFFAAKFSKPFKKFELTKRDIIENNKKIGTGEIVRLDFETHEAEKIVVKCALSPVSETNAMQNLETEIPNFDFNRTREKTKEKWNDELSKIEISTSDINKKIIFYTCLYQTMLAPTIYMDVNREYRGPDLQIHKADGFINYTRFSLWDTYRAAHPLYTLINRKRVADMVNSFLNFFDEYGALPLWNLEGQETDMMIGYHAVSVIAEACSKNISGIDYRRALKACITTANRDKYKGIGLYKKIGYVPCNTENESLSKTLEYAYDDYCIAQLAEKCGEKTIADEFFKRSKNYENVYNPKTGWLQARYSNGKFKENFNPNEYTKDICESNSWQYAFAVQQDIAGLMKLMGGENKFLNRLDSMFTLKPTADEYLPIFSTGMIGQYAHGNEPSHHIAYLYNYTSQPWKTQKYVREILNTQYANKPKGHCGNEDCGQMSAWYVLSSMGFYPVNPVSCKFEIGSPIFDNVLIKLENGKTFEITVKNNSGKNIYIKDVKLNGGKINNLQIPYNDIMNGGKLEILMGR